MKKKLLLTGTLVLFALFSAFAQAPATNDVAAPENVINHKVQPGETVMLICKKYLVTPQDVYKLNPDAIEGISSNMVLKIPADKRLDIKPKKKQDKIAVHPKSLAGTDITKNE